MHADLEATLQDYPSLAVLTSDIGTSVLDGYNNIRNYVGRPYTKTKWIAPPNYQKTKWPVVIKSSRNTKSLYNVNNATIQELSHEQFSAPSKQWYWTLKLVNEDSDNSYQYLVVTYITFYYILREKTRLYVNPSSMLRNPNLEKKKEEFVIVE